MKNIKQFANRVVTLVAVIALAVVYVPSIAAAAQITARSVRIGSSAASASTTYAFTFTVPSATIIQSADMLACTTASGTCTTPAGFSVASSTLTAQPTGLGAASGWTVSTATAGDLRLADASNATVPSGTTTVGFSSVVNPSATNSTFFFRITTYSGAYTGVIDTGTVATSTAGQITVTASVDEALTFTLSAATVALGTLTTATTGSGSTTMTASTNAGTGYSITYSGTTLTSGTNTIAALASPTASLVNNSQFGFNLMANTTPVIGSATTGTGSGAAATGYNTANQFKFLTGDTIASATLPTNSNTYTASFIGNVAGVTAAGAYQTVLTYVATANF
jgi:hypothetical protein